MPLSTYQGAVTSVAFVAGVSLVIFFRQMTGPEYPL